MITGTLLLDDASRLLGMTRRQLDREVAGVDGALGIFGQGDAARFNDEAAFRKFLDYHCLLAGQDLEDRAGAAALGEVVRITAMVEGLEIRHAAAIAEARELRRILHKVVLDNVLLTERVNELSVLRFRSRTASSPASRPWWRRLWDRLLGRGGARIGNRARRAA